MVRGDNSFALLSGDEGDDISTFLERAVKKAAEEKKKQQEKEISSKLSSDTLPPTEHGSERGTRGQGRGSRRSSRNDGGKYENDRIYSYGHNNSGDNGYRRYIGEVADYKGNRKGDERYQNSKGTAENKVISNSQELAQRTMGGKGRERGQSKTFSNNYRFRNVSQFVEGDQQPQNQEQEEGSIGDWVNVTKDRSSRDEKKHGNGVRRYGERGGNRVDRGFRPRTGRSFDGPHDGRNNGSGEVTPTSGRESVTGNGDNVYDVDNNGNSAANTEPLKDTAKDLSGENAEDGKENEVERKAREKVEKEKETERKAREEEQKEKEAKKKAWEEEQKEEAKKMTLKQYQQLLSEKKKALEAMKVEERKVTLDEDFESMRLIERKEEDSLLIKLESEKGKLKKKYDKLQKKVSIGEFLKPERGGHGRGRGGYGGGYSSRRETNSVEVRRDGFTRPNGSNGNGGGGLSAAKPVPEIEDADQFPFLGAVVRF